MADAVTASKAPEKIYDHPPMADAVQTHTCTEHAHACAHASMRAFTHTCTHICMHTCMHAHGGWINGLVGLRGGVSLIGETSVCMPHGVSILLPVASVHKCWPHRVTIQDGMSEVGGHDSQRFYI